MAAATKAGWATTAEAAAYLGYKPRTLMNWRNLRIGPHFEKPNGAEARYAYADLDAWMRAPSPSQPPRRPRTPQSRKSTPAA